ncbi:MAG: hypothetical protein EOM80_04295 [Erysipelotrichia bacterium]|nr:hypothetical protein [Erysipelotrichia bacterium]
MQEVNIPIILQAGLSSRRKDFVDYLLMAKSRLESFAHNYGWQHLTEKAFVDTWEIYDDKKAFDRRICEMAGMPIDTELPVTYSAVLEQRILISVTPELYRQNYPQGDEAEAFSKLLCHEMAHRLHIRILDGNEEAMGPVWFYEGFALFSAGQFEHSFQPLTKDKLLAMFSEHERGNYQHYAYAFRQLAIMAESFQEFIFWPSQPDFELSLNRLLQQNFQIREG